MTDLSDIGPAPGPHPARDEAERAQLMEAWHTPPGWRRISAVNNSIVGMWYLTASFAFFIFAGCLALPIRAQLAVPDNDLLSMEFYNQAFTLHGTAMMFLFAVPIFEAIAILVLPEILGARDLPFPRLSAFGFLCFLIGGVFVCGSIFFGAAPSGDWFMYPPLSSDPEQTGIGTDIWLLGLSFIEVACIAAAIELIVGVLKSRPPGMRRSDANPWGAGTLEWLWEVPEKPWGIRSIPIITTRYPLWQQPKLNEEVLRGDWFLPDAPGARRELIVTDILDARPMFVQRVPGPGYVTILAAVFLGAAFIFATYHWWLAAVVATVAFIVATVWWFWTGTGGIPEAPTRDCRRGLILPLYASGNGSVSWWAMFITMIGDTTAFAGLVFAYAFFWTVHGRFPADDVAAEGVFTAPTQARASEPPAFC